jgi:mRNA interferase YafQ
MRRAIYLPRFNKEVARMQKRNYDMEKLKVVISLLMSGEALEARHKDHPLKGSLIGFRECHIAPNWLLIYRLVGNDEIELARTGSHADLFE